MAFNSNLKMGVQAPTSAGQLIKDPVFAMSFAKYEDGLIAGRFCQAVETDGVITIKPIDATTATPVIAGVVIRDMVTNDTNVKSASVDILKNGFIVVEVAENDTPAFRGKVYVSKTAGSLGVATTTSTGTIATSGEFLYKIADNLWAISVA